jgi:hypothetical protein
LRLKLECKTCGKDCSAILNNFLLIDPIVDKAGNIKGEYHGECIFHPEKCKCEREYTQKEKE